MIFINFNFPIFLLFKKPAASLIENEISCEYFADNRDIGSHYDFI